MFIAVYEFQIKQGCQQRFRQAWLELTKSIYKHCGSFGSRLHTSEQENVLVGYAQWPSKEQWQKDHQLTDTQALKARQIMRECLIDSKTVYQLEVTEDFLQNHQAEK